MDILTSQNNKERVMPAQSSRKRKTSRSSGKAQRENWPTIEAIQKRAYEIFLTRDEQPGHELDDWLQAERELKDTYAGK